MRALSLAGGLLLATAAPLGAVVQDQFAFIDVGSVGSQGDPSNQIEFAVSTVSQPYSIGTLRWQGIAKPEADPLPGRLGSYPTWGQEMHVRVTHDASGIWEDLRLGHGREWYDVDVAGNPIEPIPREFTGIRHEHALGDLLIQPGDTFTLEFFERPQNSFLLTSPDSADDFVGADATWMNISLEFDDANPPPLAPPLPGTLRIDAQGIRNDETHDVDGTLLPGARYFGIEYAAQEPGSNLPSIVEVTLDTQDFSQVWWASNLSGDPDKPDGLFAVGESVGIDDPPSYSGDPADGSDTVDFFDEDFDFPLTFAELTFYFTPGDFGPGDSLRFGNALGSAYDAGEIVDEFLFGDSFARYDNPGMQVRITFEDGSQVEGQLGEVAPGEDFRSFVDLLVPVPPPTVTADFDLDLDVDDGDFLMWHEEFGCFAGGCFADADGDGDSDGHDFLRWQAEFGGAVLGSGSGQGVAVPQPSGSILSALAWVGFLALRRRRS